MIHTSVWLLAPTKLRSVLAVVIMLCATQLNTVLAVEPTLNPIDRDLPDFSLKGVDSTVYEPTTLKGKTWLINFWAVWCAPCLDELPALNRAWAQLKDENVGMLAINIGEDAGNIERFLSEQNLQIDFPIVIGDKIRTLGNWSGSGLPFTVIVSPAGKVVYEAVGPREWDEAQFVDAVVALNTKRSSQAYSGGFASVLARFRAMSTILKVATIAVLMLIIIAPLLFVRARSQRNSIDDLN